jgi:hypothetical protein
MPLISLPATGKVVYELMQVRPGSVKPEAFQNVIAMGPLGKPET